MLMSLISFFLVLAMPLSLLLLWSLACLLICALSRAKSVGKLLLLWIGLWGIFYACHIGQSYHAYFRMLGALFGFMLLLYPLFFLMAALMSYSSSELSTVLRQWKLPEAMGMTVSIFFRYLPEFNRQRQRIKEGRKLRRLGFTWKDPLRSFTTMVVPLAYQALAITDHLTAALLCKGVLYEGPKTSIKHYAFLWQDGLLALFILLMIGATLWLKHF